MEATRDVVVVVRDDVVILDATCDIVIIRDDVVILDATCDVVIICDDVVVRRRRRNLLLLGRQSHLKPVN